MKEQIVGLLANIAAAVIVAMLGMVLSSIRAHIQNKMAQDALNLLAATTATVVTGLANEVRNLKDPSKPGAWTAEEKQRMAARAVRDVTRIGSSAIASLRDVHEMSPQAIETLLKSLVESQVEELRRGSAESNTLPLPTAAQLADLLAHPADNGAPLVGTPADSCSNQTCATSKAEENTQAEGATDATRAAMKGQAGLGVIVLCVAFCACVAGCPLAREAMMRATPGVPSSSGCVANTTRCNLDVPEVCSATGRWWAVAPSRGACEGRCVVGDAGAYCAPAETRLASDGGVQ